MNTYTLRKTSLFDYLRTASPSQQEDYHHPDTIVRNAFAGFEDCKKNVSYSKINICGLLKTDDGLLPGNL